MNKRSALAEAIVLIQHQIDDEKEMIKEDPLAELCIISITKHIKKMQEIVDGLYKVLREESRREDRIAEMSM